MILHSISVIKEDLPTYGVNENKLCIFKGDYSVLSLLLTINIHTKLGMYMFIKCK